MFSADDKWTDTVKPLRKSIIDGVATQLATPALKAVAGLSNVGRPSMRCSRWCGPRKGRATTSPAHISPHDILCVVKRVDGVHILKKYKG